MSQDQKTVRLEVRSKKENGFRRGGRFFGPDPIEDSFDADAAQRLMNEPNLLTRVLSGNVPQKAGASAQAPAPQPPQPPPAETQSTQHDQKPEGEAHRASRRGGGEGHKPPPDADKPKV